MSTETNLREGPVVTADTRTALSTEGSITAPGFMKTPSDKTRIAYLIVAVGAETPTTTTQGGVFLVRLGGKAMGEEITIVVGGDVSQIATAGESGGPGFGLVLDVDMPLAVPGEYLELYGEHAGVDASDPNFSIAPVFE